MQRDDDRDSEEEVEDMYDRVYQHNVAFWYMAKEVQRDQHFFSVEENCHSYLCEFVSLLTRRPCDDDLMSLHAGWDRIDRLKQIDSGDWPSVPR